MSITFWSAASENIPWTCTTSEDSDKPAHSCSLIRIVTGSILDRQGCSFWSDCVDAQADLSLCQMHMSEGTFSHVATYFLFQYGSSNVTFEVAEYSKCTLYTINILTDMPECRPRFVGLGGSVGCKSDWWSVGHRFDCRKVRQHSLVEMDHEIFSMILSFLLILEG